MTSQRLATTAVTAIAVSLLALLALHCLPTGLDARWSVLSQYSLTPQGWLMSLCFLAAAVAVLCSALVLRPYVGNKRGQAGIWLLFVGALGLVLAAFFHIDPLDTPPDAMTAGAMVHNLASLLGNAGVIAGALLVTSGLRYGSLWQSVRAGLLVTANLAWIGIVLMILCIAMVVQSGGSMDGPWYVGIANRLVFAAELAWLALAVWPLRKGASAPLRA